MTYRRALKIAIVPWLIGALSIGWWIVSLGPNTEEMWYLSWRMGIVFIALYFGLAETIHRISRILSETNRYRR